MDAKAMPRVWMRFGSPLWVLLISLLLTGCLSADGEEANGESNPDQEVTGDDSSAGDTQRVNATLTEIIPTDAAQPSVISGMFRLNNSASEQPLTGLTPADFQVLQNENPLLDTNFLSIAPITQLPDLPLTETLSVVFQSNEALTQSQTGHIHEALRQLVDTKPDRQEITLFSFGETVTQHIEPTSDAEALHEALDGLAHDEGGGYSAALYEALIQATQPLRNELDLDQGIRQGSVLLITRANDMAGGSTREDVEQALEDFPTAIFSINSPARDDLAGLTSEPLFHSVEDFEHLPDELENARSSLASATAATYGFYFASQRRAGDNSVRLTLVPEQEHALEEDLTLDFNADEFTSVSPEIVLFPPETLEQGQSVELPLITRWSNRQPDYVLETDPDGIDATIVSSLDRLELTVGESATLGERTIQLANDAHAGTQTVLSFEVTGKSRDEGEEDGQDSEEGDPDGGDDSEAT